MRKYVAAAPLGNGRRMVPAERPAALRARFARNRSAISTEIGFGPPSIDWDWTGNVDALRGIGDFVDLQEILDRARGAVDRGAGLEAVGKAARTPGLSELISLIDPELARTMLVLIDRTNRINKAGTWEGDEEPPPEEEEDESGGGGDSGDDDQDSIAPREPWPWMTDETVRALDTILRAILENSGPRR